MRTPDPEGSERRAREAFKHAVEHEFESIRMHERAAARHDEIAAQHEQTALTAPDDIRDHAMDLAARERARASDARSRAEAARERLRQEGIKVDDA